MRNAVRKYCSALLVLWYCISVIGFDVHTCKGDGRSFLATVVSGMSCSDIHPGHECAAEHSRCCHGHDCCSSAGDAGESLSSDCCMDNYQVLLLTGTCPEDSHRHYDECHCGHCPCVDMPSLSSSLDRPLEAACLTSHGSVLAEPVQRPVSVRFGVWRI